jgi:hypothetical protein
MRFIGPGLPDRATAPGEIVHGLEGLLEGVYSRLPEHQDLRTRISALNHEALALAAAYAAALPPELQEFWAAYSGWFAMYSVGPLLANREVWQGVLAAGQPARLRVVENWRAEGWWSGRALLWPALADDLAAAGVPATLSPPALLQNLRCRLLGLAAGHYCRVALDDERRARLRALADPLTTEPPAPADLLWLSVGASSADLMMRLQGPLRDQYGLQSANIDFDYFGSREACRRHGLPAHDIRQFLQTGDWAQAQRWAQAAPQWWAHFQRHQADLPPADRLTPTMRAALAERLRLVLQRDAAPWLLRDLAGRRALDAIRPRAVVAFHVYGPPIAPLVIEARRRGLPQVCLQHGVIAPRYLTLPCLPFDEKLVFGSYPAQIMEQAKPPGMQVTVTGHCLYDDLDQQPPDISPEVAKLREGVAGLVVLCTQFNEEAYYTRDRWWLAGVADACRELGVRLALKLHPSDSRRNVRLYEQVLRPGDDRVLLIPHGQHPLTELLAACDIMVTRDSTVVFEANLLGKPALTVNLSRWDEELPYAATGGALGVYLYEEIKPALAALLTDSPQRQALANSRAVFLEAYVGPRDGRATERICAALAVRARGGLPDREDKAGGG